MSKIQQYFTEKGFPELINLTTSLMRLGYSTLQDKFSDYPICMIEYHENSIETFAIEVELKFDASQVTLSCGFDAAKRCDKILCTWIILKKI